jgi:hypothetical protein
MLSAPEVNFEGKDLHTPLLLIILHLNYFLQS